LGRLHLVELEDLDWFPRLWRDAGTGFLGESLRISRHPRYLAPKLRALADRTGLTRVIDLCSGGGGPTRLLAREQSLKDLAWTLTDLHPPKDSADVAVEVAGGKGDVTYHPVPVDATKVPPALRGIRTLFNGFHHFRPEGARAILQAAVDDRAPIYIAEFVERRPLSLLGMLLPPIASLFIIPLLRPFRLGWIPFTYIVPIIPLFIFWDGIVSCLRVYSLAELDTLIAGVKGKETFTWETGRLKLPGAPARSTYLVGTPK
jgi:hypothetical protein